MARRLAERPGGRRDAAEHRQRRATTSAKPAWSGSGGGISAYETQPSYQNGVVTQSATQRAVPDVAYNASTALALRGLRYLVVRRLAEVGGTSAGAPQWAALVAIADQGRASAGQGSLDGATQTLPDALPAARQRLPRHHQRQQRRLLGRRRLRSRHRPRLAHRQPDRGRAGRARPPPRMGRPPTPPLRPWCSRRKRIIRSGAESERRPVGRAVADRHDPGDQREQGRLGP